ncbi:MAG TPA: M2 family metallopeptidase [Gaiellaceae bacterium]|nr:M2 family metallopeptidase [Gaiellaceae bacterium]
MRDAVALVNEAEQRLAPLTLASNSAWWDSQVEATEENAERRTKAELALSDALADRELFAAVDAASTANGDSARQLDLLRNAMLTRQLPDALRARIIEIESSVDLRFSRHRGVVGGVEVGDTEIKRILRGSDDTAEREEAWEASKTVGAEVADDVRELARLRNEAARGLGYRDWFALSLSTDELDEQKLIDTLADCDRATVEPFTRWKGALDEKLAARFGCSVADLRPWHYADPFFQETPPDGGVDLDPLFEGQDVVALAQRTFEGIGLEVAGIVERSDLYPREGKNQHAFCIDIDRAGDVRILANTVQTHDSADTMLHELGHGVYDLGFREDLPWLLRSTHLVATEASALLSGALSGRAEWLQKILGASPSDVAELQPRLEAARAAELLVFTRWVLVMNAFERALYADPESDLDAAWWELVSRYQGVTPPDGRRAPDWASKIHVAVAPVYYHTYLYGAIVGLQLTTALEAAAGGIVDRPEAGAILRDKLFAAGESVRWDRLVEDASGKPLSVDSLARAVAKA